ncbi:MULTISPECIES: nuclear transport factor 2 family protein [Serratia]|uniref:nuclear transport factor 2 family protein n=1 Tax=Serratia TaxID=613 RepID=UPI000F7DD30A|nr:nuclear transport factor 2 family protein [Serratia marcescens]MBH3069835.1 nuclear transport factor 2 family protein [Serratia marcescens]NSM15397.1 nuclear transport factor 2 family protein [Serratia marcescens]NSM95813.1 nuclear transport factor 2 family protein [Serratia marcescens]RTF46943.1 nuclear transport factor 2 family protein [Serratia marcescens]CAF2557272.1 putative PhzA/B-like protein [Serratia marcescens]
MKLTYCAAWLIGLSTLSASAAQNNSTNNIKEKDGYYYLQKGYTDRDVAEFYWRSLEGWSEKPGNVAKYFTPDGRFELPYAPVNDFPDLFSSASQGREAITRYFSRMSQYLGNLKYSAPETWKIIPAREPGVYTFEYTSSGKLKQTGGDYNQLFIATVKIKDGQIALAHEFWDPYVALRDFGLIKKTDAN